MGQRGTDSKPEDQNEKADGQDTGLDQAAESWAENLADQVPDGVDNGPRDTANEGPDPRTGTHSSLSEASNANDDDDR